MCKQFAGYYIQMVAGMSTKNARQGVMGLIGDVNQVKAAKDNQYATYPFDYYCGFGFLVPAHVTLNKLGGGSRQDDDRAMAQAINYEQENSV
jgi:hypothetical protein